MNPSYDKLGFCCACHKQIGEFNDQGILIRWKELYQMAFMLESGSKMIISTCRDCSLIICPEMFDEIMESVIRGWKNELTQLDWTQEQKDSYMESYSKNRIAEKL